MFEFFCESISTKVERRILHWHGRNCITCVQALRLVECGYMLGGFIVDFNGYPQIPILIPTTIILPQSPFFCRSLLESRSRIKGEGLTRDNVRLNIFYSAYKSDYEKYENEYDKLANLKNRIEEDLYERSMAIIRQTREFGG